MSLRGKFWLVFCLTGSLAIGLAAYGVYALRATGAVLVRLYDEPLVAVNYARDASARLNEARRVVEQGLTLEPAKILQVQQLEAVIAEDLRIVRSRVHGEAAANALDHAEPSIAAWFRGERAILIRSVDAVTALPMPDAIERRAATATAALDDLVELAAADGFAYRAGTAADMRASGITLIGLAGGMIAISMLVVLSFGRLLIRPIRAAIRIAEDVAADNIETVQATGRRDEIGRLLNSLAIMQVTLRDRAARARGLLDERERSADMLREINTRFDIALNNMSHGLIMCGDDEKVLVVNRRYCDLYHIAPNSIPLGCAYRDVVALSEAAGSHPGRTAHEILAEPASSMELRERRTFTRSLDGDRTIAISYEPVPDGGWIAIHEDITDRRRSEEKIAFLARHDALTELPNRVLFQERLGHALALTTRGQGFALMCLDLDQFKAVNDTLGHPAGDSLLRAVADRLRTTVRDSDTVARLSGDEFAILQYSISNPSDAQALASRVIKVVSEPYELDGQRVVIGVSIGIAVAPDHGPNSMQLFRNADLALYRAKQDGRGTWRFFEPAMDAMVTARRAVEFDLREAMPSGQLEVYYQPVVCSRTRTVSGFEALLRWHHPSRGMISPAEFIPIAEDIGIIVPIGIWVLHQACREAATWPDHIRVAVNISSLQFRNQTLVTTVTDAIRNGGIAPERLELEITETVMLRDDQTTLSTLHALRALGVRITMDDFGTGYSSLSYLRRFPFDTIKIDRSFVNELHTHFECAAIIRAITYLGSVLNMSVTAEGVETEEQLQALTDAGCTDLQGYLFGKPMPACTVPALIRRFSTPQEPVRLVRGEVSHQSALVHGKLVIAHPG